MPIRNSPYCETSSVRSQSESVVPTLAPNTTATPCTSVITPELTNPTTMTVVAVELWMTQVTPMPTRSARKRLSATEPIQRLRRAPARA